MAIYNEQVSDVVKSCELCGKTINRGEKYYVTDIDECTDVCDRCQYLLSKKYNYRAGVKSFFEYLLSTDILRCKPCDSNAVEVTEWNDDEVEVFCTICNYIYRVDISKDNLINFMESDHGYQGY